MRSRQTATLDVLMRMMPPSPGLSVSAESISAGNFEDEDLRRLKERRLAVKYMIERQLEHKA